MMDSMIMDEKNDNIQNSSNTSKNLEPYSLEIQSEKWHSAEDISERNMLNSFVKCDDFEYVSSEIFNNPKPSTIEVQSEIYHRADDVSKNETLNSSVECISVEIFNNLKQSTMEIQSEACHNADKDSKQLEILNSLLELSALNFPSKISVNTANEIFKQSETSNFMECISSEITNDSKSSIMKVQPEICHNADNPESSIMEVLSEVCNDNPGPSTTEICSKMYRNTDNLGLPIVEIQSDRSNNTEIINVSSDSDSDSKSKETSFDFEFSEESSEESSEDDSSNNSSDDSYNDISIINTVKTVTNESAPSCSSLHLIDNILLPNQIETVDTSSDKQTTNVNNKIQTGLEKKVIEENNNDVLYMKKKRSKSPKAGCSKNFGNTSTLKDFYNFSNLDELLKDAKLIHALLPKLSFLLIYKTLSSNQFARNRIELTLWDLLPVERPLPQYLKKRKYSDEVNFIEHKKNSNISLQKDQKDMNVALRRKEQTHAKNEIIVDNKKSENKVSALLTGENAGMKKNTSEIAASKKDVNNINQNMMPLKKSKLIHSDGFATYLEDDNNININTIVSNSKILTSSRIDSKELHLTKNSEVKIKLNENKFDKVSKLLQPAKLTLQGNFMSQKDERLQKSTPILSPPKLKVKEARSISPVATVSNYISPNYIPSDRVIQIKNKPTILYLNPNSSINQCTKSKSGVCPNVMKQNESIIREFHPWSHLNLSSLSSNTLLSTSSNNKRASDMCVLPQLNEMWHQVIPQNFPQRTGDTNVSKVTEADDTKIANVHPIKALIGPATFHNPSDSVATVQSTSDHQKANNRNMITFQVYDKEGIQQHSILTDTEKVNWNVQLETKDALGNEKIKNACREKPANWQRKNTANDADQKEIILNEKAIKIYTRLIPMFPSIKTHFIKKLCYNYVKDDEEDEGILITNLVEMLLNCDQKNLMVEQMKSLEPQATTSKPTYDMNEQYADLLMIFPEADPVYLRKTAEEIYNDPERIKEFVQLKLENPDYPTRAQYLAKQKITQQQKQYTTDFQVQQFLKIFPDPFSYFEDDKRKCEFNPHAIDFLKYCFSKLRVNTLVKMYSQYTNNLSLTAKALEVLNPDMKKDRLLKDRITICNKITLTENIPFLQECAFIQHKAELRKYLDELKTKEEQEFNELKEKNGLFECQCCYDNECMPSKCSACEDGHIFCNSCIVRSIDIILANGNTRIDCLLQCGYEFPLSVLQQVLSPTKFSILLCKRQEAEVLAAGIEGLVSCPFCHFASIPPPKDKIFKCLNPECMKESCRLCKELNHIPLKCNEKKSESARLYLEEKMTHALIRKCYRCGLTFFKEEGCNKMTCTCGAQMCYICDKPVTNYNHFQGQGAERSNLCPLWSDDRRINAEGVIKVCQETMKKIKEKDPQVDINVDALLPKLPPKSKGPHQDIQNAMVGLQNRIARQLQ